MEELTIYYVWLSIALGVIAFVVSSWTYPLVLRMARVWKIYDNPNVRKLHRDPIPVMGGLAVFIGILVCMSVVLTIWFNYRQLLMVLAAAVLLLIGIIDDKKGLSAVFRLILEILIVTGLICVSGNMIDNMNGIFGIDKLSPFIAYPLSIIAGVGIINAINLIDGVNGYSSGFSILACSGFYVLFIASGLPKLAFVCIIVIGSMFPFFLHNVFGVKTKMFIGNGGTLMVGTIMTSLIFSILHNTSACHTWTAGKGICLIALLVAIMAIPIFDTLRVMFARICHGTSPFNADKTHLHHLFIDFGFSHIGTTLSILFLDSLVVLAWLISWEAGGSMTTQFVVVVLMAVSVTFIFYPFARLQQRKNTSFFRFFQKIGRATYWEDSPWWRWMQKLMDDELFSKGREDHFDE